jgi:hypothetical protein
VNYTLAFALQPKKKHGKSHYIALQIEHRNFKSRGYSFVACETASFEVVAEVVMKTTVFWDITPCSLVRVYRYS